MPIDKSLFNIAKNPSPLILEFLVKNPEKAFTAQEIYDGIRKVQELEIPFETIKDKLDYLIRMGKIEVAWLKGDVYYSMRPYPKL